MYKAVFIGRLVGAIGVLERHTVLVEGFDPEDARLRLYETHEHITLLKLTPVTEEA